MAVNAHKFQKNFEEYFKTAFQSILPTYTNNILKYKEIIERPEKCIALKFALIGPQMGHERSHILGTNLPIVCNSFVGKLNIMIEFPAEDAEEIDQISAEIHWFLQTISQYSTTLVDYDLQNITIAGDEDQVMQEEDKYAYVKNMSFDIYFKIKDSRLNI